MDVELEMWLLQALEIYLPNKLQADEVLQLLDRFYNFEMLKPDDEVELVNLGEDFPCPKSFLSAKIHDVNYLK